MRAIKVAAFLFLVLTLSTIYSCKNADEAPNFECGFEISTTQDIVPMVETHCAISLCHLDAVAPILDSKTAIIANAESIVSQIETFQMPPASQLPLVETEIELFQCWITDGVKDN